MAEAFGHTRSNEELRDFLSLVFKQVTRVELSSGTRLLRRNIDDVDPIIFKEPASSSNNLIPYSPTGSTSSVEFAFNESPSPTLSSEPRTPFLSPTDFSPPPSTHQLALIKPVALPPPSPTARVSPSPRVQSPLTLKRSSSALGVPFASIPEDDEGQDNTNHNKAVHTYRPVRSLSVPPTLWTPMALPMPKLSYERRQPAERKQSAGEVSPMSSLMEGGRRHTVGGGGGGGGMMSLSYSNLSSSERRQTIGDVSSIAEQLTTSITTTTPTGTGRGGLLQRAASFPPTDAHHHQHYRSVTEQHQYPEHSRVDDAASFSVEGDVPLRQIPDPSDDDETIVSTTISSQGVMTPVVPTYTSSYASPSSPLHRPRRLPSLPALQPSFSPHPPPSRPSPSQSSSRVLYHTTTTTSTESNSSSNPPSLQSVPEYDDGSTLAQSLALQAKLNAPEAPPSVRPPPAVLR
eukprot:CAMPEP_0184657292 /NCGR_PEP_ID=MMETSP0308-20130426/18414_1 /TAXON_ID=38269 /ORGANISM="Gloeochaete witrockiana, Strain SAG 46.84" /LENGTH=459 /DNA_ID=CAMNT_0027094957 /DNA_START=273 /DNA_END=1652 /DNA_ORIENTATION=+